MLVKFTETKSYEQQLFKGVAAGPYVTYKIPMSNPAQETWVGPPSWDSFMLISYT